MVGVAPRDLARRAWTARQTGMMVA
jgi:hypothetical protein